MATSRRAHERFKVAAQVFERRIVLAAGDQTLATLYFGASPAMRQMHARRDGDEAVYAVEFAAYDAPVEPDSWWNRDILQFSKDEIESIRVADLELRRLPAIDVGDDNANAPVWQWSLDQPLDQAAADDLADRLARVRFVSVLGREEKPEYGLDKPALAVSIGRRGGDTLEYLVGKRADGDGHVLKVSSRPEFFQLPSYTAEALIEAARRSRRPPAPPARGDRTWVSRGAAMPHGPGRKDLRPGPHPR